MDNEYCTQTKLGGEKARSPAMDADSSLDDENNSEIVPKEVAKGGCSSDGVGLDTALMNVRESRRIFLFCLGSLTLMSLVTRLYKIEDPPHICWDETHFGKMGSWYIKRTFFFDVHPPLGKMLIGLAGVLTGYDGSFPFNKPGDDYDDTNYVGMRMMCAILGSAVVPLCYLSVWQLTDSVNASLLAGVLVLFDTGTLTLSRYILLDPLLLFFIMLSVFCNLRFLSFGNQPFSVMWWFWLTLCGVFLACSVGIKFVGLFVILKVGYTTITDLWKILGDLSISVVTLIQHFVARVLCLIILPAFVYLLLFSIHFKVLNKSGNGDGFFSSAFQSQLIGNKLHNTSMPDKIAYGSVITLKQRRTGGAYLHSHWHLYPENHPPRQQQVTTYSHKDDNNKWRIKSVEPILGKTLQFVHGGDLILLEHVVTGRNLHSHPEVAPLTKKHYQISGYGENGTGDANDVWIVDIVSGSPRGIVNTVKTKLRLIHYHVRCGLQSHDKKLPKWGWEQLEVTCNPNVRDPKTLWSVEEVWDARLPNVSFEVYSPSLLEKFMESHAVMTQGNSGLKPKEGEVTSQPWQWPLNYRGQQFSGKDHRIYLLGNPIIFWGNLVLLALFLLFYTIHVVRKQRKLSIPYDLMEFSDKMFGACWWCFLGWALHYFPFWTMGRVLYFHHYFPAFLFNAMLSGTVLDYLITRLTQFVPSHVSEVTYHWCLGTILSGIIFSFYLFHPLVYGMSGPLADDDTSMVYGLKWLNSWEI